MSVDDEEASEKVDLEQRASAPSSSPTADVTADVETAVERAVRLQNYFEEFCNPETTPVVKDTWLWEHHKRDHYYEPDGTRPADEDDEIIPFDREEALGYPVDELDTTFDRAVRLQNYFEEFCNPETTPVVKDTWLWEHHKRLYYYESDGTRPRTEDGEIIPFDRDETLGFRADALESMLAGGADTAEQLAELVDERTVDIHPEVDEEAFFTTDDGTTTLVNRYDLEKSVPMDKKTHFTEIERYWVNEPYAFVSIFRSTKENETKYYVVEPYRNEIEGEIAEYLTGKLRTAIKYGDQGAEAADAETRREVIETETYRLLARYGLYDPSVDRSLGDLLVDLPPRFAGYTNVLLDRFEGLIQRFEEPIAQLETMFDELEESDDSPERAAGTRYGEYLNSRDRSTETTERPPLHKRLVPNRLDPEEYRLEPEPEGEFGELLSSFGLDSASGGSDQQTNLDGIAARPEPAVLEENAEELTAYQVEKLLYYLQRDFLGYERIDPIKHDINVEDISCDGYNSPVFVYHSGYEQIISNIIHGESELDDFVVKLAQRSGKGVSKRRPQVDATLPDGSRAQLTLGKEVSDHGTNYTIRQFKEVPFTPIDLINWKTFSLRQMAFLWLAIENDKSLIFAGGTASGKTTSLNAVSLFIPSNTKIVSIEDTREVELPQRNWIASVTRPSFTEDDKGDIDEFDLLEAALRQRPDYIVMGEIRGEEGRTLFQVMSTGHTTYTTFHADSVGEVLKRFTTQPINVSKTMFSALDLVSIQTSTRVKGKKVRRNKSLTEINHYDAENDEINVQDIYQWQAEGDQFLKMGTSNTLEEIKFDRGWNDDELQREIFERQLVLAYLIDRGLNTYTQVAATIQAYINDPDTILALMANDQLEASLEDLREMESVLINVDPEVEALVPRPDPGAEQQEICTAILESGEELFEEYRNRAGGSISEALEGMLESEPPAEDETIDVPSNQAGEDEPDDDTVPVDGELREPVINESANGDSAVPTDSSQAVDEPVDGIDDILADSVADPVVGPPEPPDEGVDNTATGSGSDDVTEDHLDKIVPDGVDATAPDDRGLRPGDDTLPDEDSQLATDDTSEELPLGESTTGSGDDPSSADNPFDAYLASEPIEESAEPTEKSTKSTEESTEPTEESAERDRTVDGGEGSHSEADTTEDE